MHRKRKTMLVAAFIATGIFFVQAQKGPEKNWNSGKILHEIKKLKQLGRVLYVAAHPDDENTQLISYLVNDAGFQTAYISMTRGDGGQDLLGPEVREELGVIRTQELLMARATDGGQQFFTRANDFGFSKTAAETFHIWNKNDVLSDLVWTIRRFKPDIIITRFSPTYTKTHGHHQASAILAMDAFNAAADSTQFPEQISYTGTWKAKGLFWNTSPFFFNTDTAGLYHTDIGSYIPLLGKSVGELAAESRSMHKSQGMGTSPRWGSLREYFVPLEGNKPLDKDIFSMADGQWNAIKGCESVDSKIDKLVHDFSMQAPQGSIPSLIELYTKLQPFKSNYLVAAKMEQIEDIILHCAGVYSEALSTKEFLPVGDSVNASLNLIHQDAGYEIHVDAALMIDGKKLCDIAKDSKYGTNTYTTFKAGAVIPENANITGPYWLEEEPTVGMYTVKDQSLRGLPQNPQQVTIHITYKLSQLAFCEACPTIKIEKDIPVFHKVIDPVKGEIYALAKIVPPAIANPETKLLLFANGTPKELGIKIKSFKKGKATVSLNAPAGWNIEPSSKDIEMKGDGAETPVSFMVTPPASAQTASIDISIQTDGHTYNRSLEDIKYEHIPEQILLPKSKVKAIKMDIKTSNKLIGYINGAGDDVAQLLKELGYSVDIIPPAQLATINLSKYDVIIAGVRAYNTVDRLKYDNARLLEYVKNGGTYIVQYNTFNGFNSTLVTDNIGPYLLTLSSERTTEEDSKITFVHPENPVLNTPNKISEADFENWVQERGLYYPNKWDTLNYVPILQMADAGEKPTQGALLVATYGKGNFVYTGLSFFRELPAGVPGAYRLFVNLIEMAKHGK